MNVRLIRLLESGFYKLKLYVEEIHNYRETI